MDNFKLKKVKTRSSSGLSVSYEEESRTDNVIKHDEVTRSSDRIPHPDLLKAIEKLDKYLASTHQINAVNALMKSDTLKAEEKKAFKVLKPLLDNLQQKTLENIEVTGISLGGSDRNSVVITGKTKFNKSGAAINSPRIRLDSEIWGFEQEILDVINTLEDEVYQYLFKNKQAQLDLFEEKEEEQKEAA